jgi:DNA-directed RNA polymerase specialized sigma24 family protein
MATGLTMTDRDPPLIDDLGLAVLIARLEAATSYEPDYGVTRENFIATAESNAKRRFTREQARRKRIQRATISLETLLDHQIPSAPDDTARVIDFLTVLETLAAIPHPQRSALILTGLLGYTRKEAACALGVDKRAFRHLADSGMAMARRTGFSP